MTVVDYDTGEILDEPRIEALPAARPRMPKEIAAAIVKVMKGITQLGYDSKNDHAKYNYASVDKFYDSLRPLMADAGIFTMLDEDRVEFFTSENGRGESSNWLRARYMITIHHEAGVEHGPYPRQCIVPASGAQAFAAVQSYLQKYFLRALFQVPTGEKDADVDATAGELPKQQPRSAPRSVPSAPPARQEARPAASAPEPGTPGKPTQKEAEAAYNRLTKAITETLDHDALNQLQETMKADVDMVKAFSQSAFDKLNVWVTNQHDKITKGVPTQAGPAGEPTP